jgi:DNA-binding transcriptional ArsR family regulator
MTTGDALVLLRLAHHHNATTGECYPGIAHLAEVLGIDRRNVRRAIHRLELAGIITVDRDRGRGNRYRFPGLEVAETNPSSYPHPTAYTRSPTTTTPTAYTRSPNRVHAVTPTAPTRSEQERTGIEQGRVPCELCEGSGLHFLERENASGPCPNGCRIPAHGAQPVDYPTDRHPSTYRRTR